jgi:hypothetical protein
MTSNVLLCSGAFLQCCVASQCLSSERHSINPNYTIQETLYLGRQAHNNPNVPGTSLIQHLTRPGLIRCFNLAHSNIEKTPRWLVLSTSYFHNSFTLGSVLIDVICTSAY